jgi:aminocarboxymuconate-semialdehyde decarboxylase
MTVIDLHNHFIAPEVIDFLAREGHHYATRIVERDGRRFFLIRESALRPIDGAISNAGARIVDMDREGITTQAVSCVPFLMYPEVAADLGLAIAQVNNDSLAALAARDRDHFVPLASVPLQDPVMAANELERAAKLGLRGVEIPPKVGNASLTKPISRSFGRPRKHYSWRCVYIRLRPRRPEHWPAIFWAISSAIFTTPDWRPLC